MSSPNSALWLHNDELSDLLSSLLGTDACDSLKASLSAPDGQSQIRCFTSRKGPAKNDSRWPTALNSGNQPLVIVIIQNSSRDRVIREDGRTLPANSVRRKYRIRRRGASPEKLSFGSLEIELRTLRAWRAGRQLRLTRCEFILLERLIRARGSVVSRRMFKKDVWDGKRVRPNSVDAMIYRLRAKIDRPFQTNFIQTVPGLGYYLSGTSDVGGA